MEVSFNDVIETSYCEDSEQFVIKLDNGIYISNTIDMEYAVCEKWIIQFMYFNKMDLMIIIVAHYCPKSPLNKSSLNISLHIKYIAT